MANHRVNTRAVDRLYGKKFQGPVRRRDEIRLQVGRPPNHFVFDGLATKPLATGSPTFVITMGMVVMRLFSANTSAARKLLSDQPFD